MTDTPTLFTLSDARRHRACADGYARFENALRKAYPDAVDLDTIQWSIGDVARLNLSDARWCLRMVADPRQRVSAIMPAVRRVSRHTDDSRVHDCITQIDRWLAGEDINLVAAKDAAWAAKAAAWVAADAAGGAAAEAAAWAAKAAGWGAVSAADAAAWAAVESAADARKQERAQQAADLIAAFPPTLTSELRPAVEVWRKASDAATDGSVKYQSHADQAAAAVIEADRAAIIAAKDAEIAALKNTWQKQFDEKVRERGEAKLWFEKAQEWKQSLAALQAACDALAEHVPDYIGFFRIITRAGRSNPDKAKALTEYFAPALRAYEEFRRD